MANELSRFICRCYQYDILPPWPRCIFRSIQPCRILLLMFGIAIFYANLYFTQVPVTHLRRKLVYVSQLTISIIIKKEYAQTVAYITGYAVYSGIYRTFPCKTQTSWPIVSFHREGLWLLYIGYASVSMETYSVYGYIERSIALIPWRFVRTPGVLRTCDYQHQCKYFKLIAYCLH